jgi:hypothetical protein
MHNISGVCMVYEGACIIYQVYVGFMRVCA